MTTTRISLAVTFVGVLCTPMGAVAVDVPAVSGEPTPLQVGESRTSLRLEDGKEVKRTSTRIDERTVEVVREDGCSWTWSTQDSYGPNLSWKNCSPGPWGTGKAYDFEKTGQLWPLAVGNKVEYRFVTENSEGKKNRKAFRKCEVTGTEVVKAGGTDYPTYRVECTEHNGNRVFNYAPEAQTTVRSVRNHNKNGTSTMEYLGRP